MLITSLNIQAQVKNVYNKSFDAQNIKTLALNLDKCFVSIEISNDNNIHFDYTAEFNNYSKNKVAEYLEKITVSSEIIGDKLEFSTKSEVNFGVVYTFESHYGITFEGDHIVFKKTSNREFRKSKQYFLSLNSSSRGKSIKEYLKNLREVNSNGKKKKINIKNVKTVKTKFVIRIPKHINLNIVANNSNLDIKEDFNNQITVKAKDTELKFKNLKNPLNDFDIENGNFRCNAVYGGSYKFNHVKKVQVSELSNLKIESELTGFNIGEIGTNVEINDFNSKFWLHNFSKDFTSFKMNTEYSEINLFHPENMTYLLTTFGHDTVHFIDNISTEIGPSKENQSSKMVVFGDESKTYSNKIEIKSKHGIIRFGKDFIDFEP